MVKRIIATLNVIMPFLQQCPKWIQVLVAAGLIYVFVVIVVILIWFLFFSSPQKQKTNVLDNHGRTKLNSRIKKRVDDLYNEIYNEKLKPWIFINTGKPLRIEKHDGTLIQYEGVGFEGTSIVFWGDNFIPPIIENAIVKAFDQTIEECRKNNIDPKPYIYETNSILAGLIGNVYNRMADIDRKLRGKGYPKNVQRKDVNDKISKMDECLKGHYNAAIFLASKDESALHQESKSSTDKKWYKKVSTWVISSILFLVALTTLILNFDKIKSRYFPKKTEVVAPQKEEQPKSTSTPVITSNIKPILEIKVDPKKNLTLENKGPTNLKDISIFATRYVFDENCFGKEVKIKEYNKIGGSLYKIPMLEAKIGRESFDLTEQSFIKFYESPFGKDNYMPFITFYCFRVTYIETNTGTKYTNYIVTTAYKDYPSQIENQETTASWGTPEGDFMYKIPKVIKDHQKTIFGE